MSRETTWSAAADEDEAYRDVRTRRRRTTAEVVVDLIARRSRPHPFVRLVPRSGRPR
ncbi:hypothetical protein [Actinomycetospora termitidis]|uniref:Uncharacterized protein n=1 Tax=Actinomycetospora termitidis TaxID=3053470 RepID=A0ABT7MFF6_9PSEU|nr:hypothetical protein [Actinomycetospora sp. Odt1-22]MDL5159176.1 hypothetical protein [Actinomycetospora sp. Odt1-22]